jgi:hypothetical protein
LQKPGSCKKFFYISKNIQSGYEFINKISATGGKVKGHIYVLAFGNKLDLSAIIKNSMTPYNSEVRRNVVFNSQLEGFQKNFERP